MGDVVNLKQFRKKKQRAEKAEKADENRARSGRTKEQKHQDNRQSADLNKHLDAHKTDQNTMTEKDKKPV